MAYTVTPTIKHRGRLNPGGLKFVIADLICSGTYAAGGTELTAANFGLLSLEDVVIMDGCGAIAAGGTTGLIPHWDRSTKMLQLFRVGPATGTKTDVFPYTQASINAADDVSGDKVVSDVATLLGANHSWIVTSATFTAAGALEIAKQPDVPRNLVYCELRNAGATNASTACNFVTEGTFNGATVTETINLPVTTMANADIIYRTGYQPFDSITSITPSANAAAAAYEIRIGLGSRLGLSQALLTPVHTDVKLITQKAVAVAISNVTDQTTGTVKTTAGKESVLFGTIAANDDCVVKYDCVGGPAASASLAEVGNITLTAAGTATPTIRVMALGV
jgi:hypothetical protein